MNSSLPILYLWFVLHIFYSKFLTLPESLCLSGILKGLVDIFFIKSLSVRDYQGVHPIISS